LHFTCEPFHIMY